MQINTFDSEFKCELLEVDLWNGGWSFNLLPIYWQVGKRVMFNGSLISFERFSHTLLEDSSITGDILYMEQWFN